MGYGLSKGISFCRTSDRLVFLDVPRDRYFCLNSEAEGSFTKLIGHEPLNANDEVRLTRLQSDGVIVPQPDERTPQACLAPLTPQTSMLDQMPLTVTTGDVARALGDVATAIVGLRLLRLNRALGRVRRFKERSTLSAPGASESAQRMARAFHLTELMVPPHDRCLPRSIAVAHRFARLGIPADLVVGVKLRPFGAHCWVQVAEQVVNDSIDQVRNFTPILVI
jgi:hypothetical protein